MNIQELLLTNKDYLIAGAIILIILFILPEIFKKKDKKSDEVQLWQIEDLPKLTKFNVIHLYKSKEYDRFCALLNFNELPDEFKEKFGDKSLWVNFSKRAFEKLKEGENYIIKGYEPTWVSDSGYGSAPSGSTLSASN